MKHKHKKKNNTQTTSEYPNVSILTPTFNRRKFLPLMIYNIQGFIYDKSQLEWFIYDDGSIPLLVEEELEPLRKSIHPVKLKYVYSNRKKEIGTKRNYLVKNATHKTVIMMDDDDIYFPSYIKYSIDTMKQNKVSFVGSPQMLFIYPKWNWRISAINCPAKRQCHEATMCFTKKYFNSMSGGFNTTSRGEGAKMVDFNENNVATTEIYNCMMCVSHKENTLSKEKFAKNELPTRLKNTQHLDILKHILKDEYSSEEYVHSDQETNESGEPKESGDSGESDDTGDSGEPKESGESGDSGESDDTGDSGDSGDSDEPKESGESDKTK